MAQKRARRLGQTDGLSQVFIATREAEAHSRSRSPSPSARPVRHHRVMHRHLPRGVTSSHATPLFLLLPPAMTTTPTATPLAAAGSKALSTSTLSLKFMQNAAARKGATATGTLTKAEVQDEVDGAWAVPGADARRAMAESEGREGVVSYEASYMPFLFGTETKGRRAFRKGREVDELGAIATEKAAPAQELPPVKAAGKVRAISSQSGLPEKNKKAKKEGGSARDAIFAAPVTGLPSATPDPPTQRQKTKKDKDRPPTFLRPAGVDAPPSQPSTSKATMARPVVAEERNSSVEEIAPPEETATKSKKSKRGREEPADGSSPAQKPTKKPKTSKNADEEVAPPSKSTQKVAERDQDVAALPKASKSKSQRAKAGDQAGEEDSSTEEVAPPPLKSRKAKRAREETEAEADAEGDAAPKAKKPKKKKKKAKEGTEEDAWCKDCSR
ncbi:hypothetical protein MIND_00394800 [Mycena indigotica]|uniref:Uncharacterized protein n=1 Tax=Mycena indigotica TaxID=2126181 RepID=A0A8H6T4Q6_9AGAR|nr:uncharacterized protein MIND_00394800 [Mycena indigotica]KAF7310211.1 hypothetical protein MIND_00394800 [Mycena indigotica]